MGWLLEEWTFKATGMGSINVRWRGRLIQVAVGAGNKPHRVVALLPSPDRGGLGPDEVEDFAMAVAALVGNFRGDLADALPAAEEGKLVCRVEGKV